LDDSDIVALTNQNTAYDQAMLEGGFLLVTRHNDIGRVPAVQ
jgi:hypothetical protein